MPKTDEQVYISVDGKQLEIADGQMVSAVIDQDLNQPDMCVLSLTDGNAWMAKDTFATGKELKLELQMAKDRKRIFIGEIVGMEPVYESSNHVKLVIRAFDRSHRLTRGRKSHAYQQMKDSDIAKKIAQDNGFGMDIQESGIVYKHIYQHNQTDLEFLQLRAARINYEVGVDDKKLYFKERGKPSNEGAVKAPVKVKLGETLYKFTPRLSAAKQVSKVTVRGWDATAKKEVVGVASKADVGPKIQLPSNGGDAARTAFGKPEEMHVTVEEVHTQGDAEAKAKAILEEALLGFITGEGQTEGNPAIQPGAQIEITGTEKFDGTYTASTVGHRFDRAGYKTTFKFRSAHSPSSPVAAMSASTGGVGGGAGGGVGAKFAVGIVTNNEDPEGQGRIRVKLPTHGDGIESDWARLVSPMAGSGRGFFYLPEVNDEVLVAFEGGSHSRPIVLGSFWNGTDKQPLEASKAVSGGKVVQRIIKSRKGHTILLDDTDGDEKISIEDEKGNKIQFECKSDKLTIEFAGNIDIKSKANVTIEASGNMTLKANGNMDVEASGMTNVKGSMINLN